LALYSLFPLHIHHVKLDDLQRVVDTCGKNYPTLRKLLVLFHQIYEYALKHELTLKDYSEFVDILKYKNRNPNKADRDRLTKDEIDKLWTMKDDKYYQIVLMLIYNGVRISELLDLKKENVHLEEQYFDVIDSKTENGIRKVPIANKVLEFYKGWFNDGIDSDYLLHTDDGKHFLYRNYYDSYFKPLMKNLYIERTPHCCRHTCISMLADARVDQTTIKKIVGHAGAMTLTEKVYTHMDIGELVKAINLI
jgi:site-specific recombinase, phage integrase family